ncbi:hypothetical protein M0G43_13065 [Subsaxibacter sp. CAU 1640]|uniref:hypothetical protein n=1 Tax=Subsaxibacter sp. CAU 1640 TaxID=2933271 RepID=UPI0020054FC9|nr:hypothetical protein [Subsaxibacter sp. CAU 1640]MCK7591510.1 hypothetical protein [Subsaxibacter sp. CAU 1640]
MKLQKLQIVSFENPYPPNYGGIIDVYYKIKYLSKLNIEIYLHIYTHDRFDISKLQTYCKKVYTYKRNKSIINFLSKKPYRVTSRVSDQIYNNLRQVDAPIIFEGLQSTEVLLSNKPLNKLIVRAHNIEHLYYYGLSQSASNIFKKWLYKVEGYKFKHYEKLLHSVNAILALSKKEYNYFSNYYDTDTYYLPVFHGNQEILRLEGKGDYALYHGDLTTEDNISSAKTLISVFANLPYKFVIASSQLPSVLQKVIQNHKNISFEELGNNEEDLLNLISNAHVNVLYSNQPTGTKLKVFYALYNGRFCVINDNIVDDDAIRALCEIANTQEELAHKIHQAFGQDFNYSQERDKVLKEYLPLNQAEKLVNILNEIINK